MSGVEVAGLVLGAFPIMIAVIDGMYSQYKGLMEWRKFQARYSLLASDLRTEHRIFENTLERALLDENAAPEIYSMLEDPKSPRWRDRTLGRRLQRRLGPSYEE